MFLNVDASDAPIRVKTVFEKKKILKKRKKPRKTTEMEMGRYLKVPTKGLPVCNLKLLASYTKIANLCGKKRVPVCTSTLLKLTSYTVLKIS
jgi:hypothetical protein